MEDREMKRLLSKHSKLAAAYESDKTVHRTAIDRLAAECEDSSKKEANLARQKLQTQREEIVMEAVYASSRSRMGECLYR